LYKPLIAVVIDNSEMISKLMDFIYDIARLDKLETKKQKEQFITLLSEKIEERIMIEES
jgi:hypothetical protein